MWVTDKLTNSVIPTETKNINADQGAPQYCLKGFKVNDIDTIDYKNQKLSNIKNLILIFILIKISEYFIENINNYL